MSNLTHDNWYNPATGVGGPDDKSAGFVFDPTAHLYWGDALILSALYESDDLAATKVDEVVEDALRKGWTVDGSLEPDQAETLTDTLDNLKATDAIQQARKWSRLYGKAAVYIGTTDGGARQFEPIKDGSQVFFLQPYEKDELQPSRFYDDMTSPNFGEPSHYRITPLAGAGMGRAAGLEIHESRLIIFHGERTTKTAYIQNNYAGSSVLLRPMSALRNLNGAYALTLSLLADANQNIYRWAGLGDMLLAENTDELVEKRLKVIERVRSATKALVLDAETEDFVRSQLTLSGLDSLLTKFETRACAAYKMPATKLFGTSPGGLNATGDSDLENWDAQVESERTDELKPALERVVRHILRSKAGPTEGVEPDKWTIKFPPLREAKPRDDAEIKSINAQTHKIYWEMGALKTHHVAEAEFSGERKEPQLTDDELAALRLADGVGGRSGDELIDFLSPKPPAPAMPTAPAQSLPLAPDPLLDLEAAPDLDVADVDTVDSGPQVDVAIAAFAEKMTAKGIEACRHGFKNRCPRCGIERVPDVDIDANGNAVFSVIWRPIGTAQTVAVNAGQQEDTTDKADPKGAKRPARKADKPPSNA